MKERPILFSAPMVRAILDSSKSQTRRIVKHQPDGTWCRNAETGLHTMIPMPDKADGIPWWNIGGIHGGKPCKYGFVGDRLWVRETWANGILDYGIVYAADRGDVAQRRIVNKWNTPIFMPRWASRILLEVTGVRVERLHDISEEDAIAEGVGGDVTITPCFAVERYRALWETINGTGSWDKNPFVWVIEFKKLEVEK